MKPKDKPQIEKTKVDIKSRLGYFSEFVVAYELAVLIAKKNGRLTDRSKVASLKKNMMDRKNFLLKVITKKQMKELARQESGGKLIAERMFNDIILKGNDHRALEFDIELTGDTAKGVGKADVVLVVKTLSKTELVDEIAASLKTYKTPNINLSNQTFTGFLKEITGNPEAENEALQTFERIIFDSMVNKFMELEGKNTTNQAKWQAAHDIAVEAVGSGEAFLKTYGIECFEKLKEAGRDAAKAVHPEVSRILVREFNKSYKVPACKKKINMNIVRLLGLDGGDDFYAAIGETGKQKILSSRQSEEMRKFIEDLKSKDLNIKMTPSKTGKAIDVEIYLIEPRSKTSRTIAKSTISFTDTGIGSSGMTKSKGAGKTNFWFNVKRFL